MMRHQEARDLVDAPEPLKIIPAHQHDEAFAETEETLDPHDTANLQFKVVLRDAGLVHPTCVLHGIYRLVLGPLTPRTAHVEELVAQLLSLLVGIGIEALLGEELSPILGRIPAV